MRGILMFAHNNGLFDYGKMAYASACAAAHYIEEPISLVTDRETWDSLNKQYRAGMVFDRAIFIDSNTTNSRHFDMVDGTSKKAAYHNTTRLRAYELSPYDETLMIDTDVLVQDSSLAKVWGTSGPSIRMNRHISEMVKEAHAYEDTVQWLESKSLQLLWATITYFRSDPVAKQFFELTKYVVDNYDYYGVLYGFPTNLLRVDFALTISAHIMSGYVHGAESVVGSLPKSSTLFAWNKDIMVDVDPGKATFITKYNGQEFPVVTRQTVHCMNKDSMLANADRIIECYA